MQGRTSHKECGLTLIELMIAIAVMSIIIFTCTPIFTDLVQRTLLRQAALGILHDIEFTRSSAVLSGHRTSIQKAGESWQNGWFIFHDRNNNGQHDNNEEVLRARDEVTTLTISANKPVETYVSFIDTGESRRSGSATQGAFIAGSFTICHPAQPTGYKVIIARGGRARLATASDEEC